MDIKKDECRSAKWFVVNWASVPQTLTPTRNAAVEQAMVLYYSIVVVIVVVVVVADGVGFLLLF